MRLAQFIMAASGSIIAEWEEFARTCEPAASGMDLPQRRDDIAGMLKAIALDLGTSQTTHEQTEKSKGRDDADRDSNTAATAHGTARAATGYTPVQMVSEFRALRASVLKLWSQTQSEFKPTDVADVFRFNEAIDQALAESTARYAYDVDRSKALFLSMLGHDLRDPLDAILSAAATITKAGTDGVHSTEASSILSSGQRMEATLHALEDFTQSRLGGGILVFRAPTDMTLLCRRAADAFTAAHPGRDVHVEAAGTLKGEWDGGRIAELLSNLIAHAHQHARPNTAIEVAADREPVGVVLTVHYKGPTIARRDLQDIFNPFPPPASAHAAPGQSKGLGLYLAQAIVTAHHGTIHVASTEARTTFTVRLPLAPDAPSR
ncbi:MAG: ATP-binding region ATPase domain protein [Myxococcaceae bacterium]|nr:ATP-binding region ATPase domain protein [Myxococcaceae bacterium]